MLFSSFRRAPFIPFSTPGELTLASNRSLSIDQLALRSLFGLGQKYGVVKIVYRGKSALYQLLRINFRIAKKETEKEKERKAHPIKRVYRKN